jgi:putative hydrolase of the HAD superfamily
MPFTTIFFDLDETLYPASSGVWPLIKERMNLYMHDQLGIEWDDIPSLRENLFRAYGTTLRGLQANFSVNSEEYLAFVHDISMQDHLQADEPLRQMLDELPQRKFIFTNADASHAKRVLAALGIEACFDGIVDIKAIDPYCKPMKEAFRIALELTGETVPQNCILVDDLEVNTRAAREYGLFSILFGQQGDHPDADATMSQLLDLPGLLKRIKY